jgi:hypothetical protein
MAKGKWFNWGSKNKIHEEELNEEKEPLAEEADIEAEAGEVPEIGFEETEAEAVIEEAAVRDENI